MTYIPNFIKGMPLMDLYEVRAGVEREIERQKKLLINSVSVEKNQFGTIYLNHTTNGTYVCKKAAYKGRWRMWKMIPGQRGPKQGPVVVNEHQGDLDDLRIQVALGYYKDVGVK